MSILETKEFMDAAVEDKIAQSVGGDPSRKLAMEMFQFLLPKNNLEVNIILAALSMVLATVAVESGMEEEKAVYAFRKSYGKAQRRLKALLKQVQ